MRAPLAFDLRIESFDSKPCILTFSEYGGSAQHRLTVRVDVQSIYHLSYDGCWLLTQEKVARSFHRGTWHPASVQQTTGGGTDLQTRNCRQFLLIWEQLRPRSWPTNPLGSYANCDGTGHRLGSTGPTGKLRMQRTTSANSSEHTSWTNWSYSGFPVPLRSLRIVPLYSSLHLVVSSGVLLAQLLRRWPGVHDRVPVPVQLKVDNRPNARIASSVGMGRLNCDRHLLFMLIRICLKLAACLPHCCSLWCPGNLMWGGTLCPIQKGTQNIQKGDQKGTKRGPKGDQKGTKKGTQNSSWSKNWKEITCWNLTEIESRRRENYVCFLLSFKQTNISLIKNFWMKMSNG